MLKNSAVDDIKAISENDYSWIINNQLVTNVFHIYLNEEIAEQKHYRDILNCLRAATAEDYFVIYINNFGGMLHTAIDIMNAMKACKGTIVVRVTGPVYSAAPLIVLSANKIIIEDNVFFMFHDYSGGSAGKGHEQKADINNFKPFFDDMLATITKGFLSVKEIKAICSGTDLYVKRDDVIRRLKKQKKLVSNE